LWLPGPMTGRAFTRQWQRRSTLARRSSAHARHKDLGVGPGRRSVCAAIWCALSAP